LRLRMSHSHHHVFINNFYLGEINLAEVLSKEESLLGYHLKSTHNFLPTPVSRTTFCSEVTF
jgi:hypothetical protein